ncbi:MAG: NAD(P)H-binding protein [Ilumatobacteraceae bacterium]
MILVTGATGNAGGAVVRALLGAGEEVRALVRREADRSRLPAAVDAVTGDLNEPATLRVPLQDVWAVFLLSGYRDIPGVLAEMRGAGVERIVLLSSSAAPDGDLSNAIAHNRIVSERAVRESGVAFTLLQPNTFMSNTFRWIPQLRDGDAIRAPFTGVRTAMIDPDDVGAVAALALTSTGHEGRAYRLSGPESLLPADCVAVLADVLGRQLRLEAQTDAEARAEMSATMPPEHVDALFRFYADGALDESNVLATVRDLTGRGARRFEQWAITHADRFRAAPAPTQPPQPRSHHDRQHANDEANPGGRAGPSSRQR